jgi:glucosamine-6-phosphate deaminase
MTLSLNIKPDRKSLGHAAAALASSRIRKAIEESGESNLILATGSSQFEMLEELRQANIDWSKVTCFHLDEYAGISSDHSASFVKFLCDRFYDQVHGLKGFHFIDGQASDLEAECHRLSGLIQPVSIDVACIGIGENGHLAFNDPPADFETEQPYLVVQLDAACRRQQVGEGWFPSLEDVPEQAISMSVHQILKSKCLVVSVPDQRKANAVREAIEGPVQPEVPASILQRHSDCHLFLDQAAASMLRNLN